MNLFVGNVQRTNVVVKITQTNAESIVFSCQNTLITCKKISIFEIQKKLTRNFNTSQFSDTVLCVL